MAISTMTTRFIDLATGEKTDYRCFPRLVDRYRVQIVLQERDLCWWRFWRRWRTVWLDDRLLPLEMAFTRDWENWAVVVIGECRRAHGLPS